MEPLPTQLLEAAPYVKFGIFNLTLPNIIAWLAAVVILFVAMWWRMPKVFESKP